eukprot:1161643-Pelagomonas_calceolata.AAC.17
MDDQSWGVYHETELVLNVRKSRWVIYSECRWSSGAHRSGPKEHGMSTCGAQKFANQGQQTKESPSHKCKLEAIPSHTHTLVHKFLHVSIHIPLSIAHSARVSLVAGSKAASSASSFRANHGRSRALRTQAGAHQLRVMQTVLRAGRKCLGYCGQC